MTKTLLVNKVKGLTPLELLNKIRDENPELKNEKLAYAGRLDPMAEGLMLVLIGDECKNRDAYQGLDKEYEFEALFGVETDTYDILGKITNYELGITNIRVEKVVETASRFVGEIEQEYPPYSSINVQGKPLFWWARNNKLAEITIPKKHVQIKSIAYIDSYEIGTNKLSESIKQQIAIVKGDFRQKEIIGQWEEFFKKCVQKEFTIYKFKAEVSSGTYIRSIIHEMGKLLGTGAIAYNIRRTRIGEFVQMTNVGVRHA